MKKRIKKKTAIRKCEKAAETISKLFRESCELGEDTEEFIKGINDMYSRRIATIRKGGTGIMKNVNTGYMVRAPAFGAHGGRKPPLQLNTAAE